MNTGKITAGSVIPFLFSAAIFLPNGIKTIALCAFVIHVFPRDGFRSYFENIRKDGMSLAFIGFFFFTALSYFWSENKAAYFDEVQSKLPFLLIPFSLFSGNRRLPASEKGTLKAFYFTGIAISLACLFSSIFLKEGVFQWENLVYEKLAEFSRLQPIYLALFLIISSLCWYKLYLRKELPEIWLHKITPVFLYLMIVLLSSRAELMVYTGGIVFILFRHFRKKVRILALFLVAFSGLTAALILMSKTNSDRFREMFDLKNDYHSNQWGGRSLRIEKWKNTLECYLSFPFLGTGAGDCSDELQKVYLRNGFDIAFRAQYNPHNQYLQTLLTLGPLGLGLFLSMFIIAFYRAWRQRNFLLFLLTYAFAASMITESMLERQAGIFLFTVLLGFFASLPENSSKLITETEPVQ